MNYIFIIINIYLYLYLSEKCSIIFSLMKVERRRRYQEEYQKGVFTCTLEERRGSGTPPSFGTFIVKVSAQCNPTVHPVFKGGFFIYCLLTFFLRTPCHNYTRYGQNVDPGHHKLKGRSRRRRLVKAHLKKCFPIEMNTADHLQSRA